MFLSLLMASKFHEDTIHNNEFYAKVSGIRKNELWLLEIEFMELIEHKLFVDHYAYKNLVTNLNALFHIKPF